MSSRAYSRGQSVECPHCGGTLGGVEGFVVPGFTGESSRRETKCQLCHVSFYVEHVGKGEYWVDSEPYEDYDDEEDDVGKKW